jgi:hypothetical protein
MNKELLEHIIASVEKENIVHLYDLCEAVAKECMICCERVISDPVPDSVDTWLNGGLQCIDEIKEHFGVEE